MNAISGALLGAALLFRTLPQIAPACEIDSQILACFVWMGW